MTLVQIYLITITITISNNFLSYFMFFTQNSPSWIRIRILNTDPDPGGKMNADPDPQPWFPSKKICTLLLHIYVCSGYSILRVLRRRKRAAYVHRTNLWMLARICWRFFAQFLLWKHAVICVFFWHGYCLVSRSVADPDNFCPAPDPSDIEVRIWLRIRLRIQILDIKKLNNFK